MTRCSRTPLLLFVLLVWSLLTAMLGTLLTALIYIPWFDGNDGPASSMLELPSTWWDSPAYWIHIAVIVPLLVGTQVLFLLPVARSSFAWGRSVRFAEHRHCGAGGGHTDRVTRYGVGAAGATDLRRDRCVRSILFSGLDGVFIHPQLYLQWVG